MSFSQEPNRTIDTDRLAAGFTRCQTAGHRGRYVLEKWIRI
jgi:hypothetical protein